MARDRSFPKKRHLMVKLVVGPSHTDRHYGACRRGYEKRRSTGQSMAAGTCRWEAEPSREGHLEHSYVTHKIILPEKQQTDGAQMGL